MINFGHTFLQCGALFRITRKTVRYIQYQAFKEKIYDLPQIIICLKNCFWNEKFFSAIVPMPLVLQLNNEFICHRKIILRLSKPFLRNKIELFFYLFETFDLLRAIGNNQYLHSLKAVRGHANCLKPSLL